jgi:23S rRNA (pseudouridine1915-N3)-methyltransferase
MRLVVVQTGRIKDAHVLALREDYLKRFRRYGSLVVEERTPKRDQPLWPASARWRVALDERGEQPGSAALAELLRGWTMRHGEVAFLIGEAYGHHAPSFALSDVRLSLGPLTLPHQLAHLLLIEQLYRAATILAGTPYHHA